MTSEKNEPRFPSTSAGPGRWLDLVLGGCASLILFLLMMLAFVDVVGRELFNAPIPGGFEITQLMMAALIFTALPIVSLRDEHVVIDLLDSVMPAGVSRWRGPVVNLIATVAMGALSWECWVLAAQLHGDNEITEYLEAPVWPIIYLISVMGGITTVVFATKVAFGIAGRETTSTSTDRGN